MALYVFSKLSNFFLLYHVIYYHLITMEFFRSGAKECETKPILQKRYPTDLNLYTDIPAEQIDIEEFQNLAVERVKLLKLFETVSARGVRDLPYKEQILNEAIKQNVKYFIPMLKGLADFECRRNDHLSHFILRLFYCRSEEYRKWFIARELDFFRFKFSNTDKKEEVLLFMKKNNLNYMSVSEDERRALGEKIFNSTAKNIILETANIYKVPFVQVLDLVRGRKVFIKNGFAYVPHQDLASVLNTIFRSKLSRALSICSANIPIVESDERLGRILNGLHNSYTETENYLKRKDKIPISALDSLSLKSYPLCMRHMHETFKKTHHLKHMARLQYGLFLKGIGVTLEDSLRFWKEGFTKKEDIDAEKFEKTYAYSIRHNYGKEGKRADYTPHSCIKIITTSVGPGDNHGCPFKHSDENHLRQKLLSYNVNISDVADIIKYVNNGHYQLACTKYFEIVHNISNAKGVNHPNSYFEESLKLSNINTGSNDNFSSMDFSVIE